MAVIGELNRQIAALETELAAHFEQHPDADIYLSQPGIGVILGARVLGEFGDDPNRYADAKSRKDDAGTSSLRNSPGARAFYDRRRRLGDSHHKALRALGNRLVGILHRCLGTRTTYDEHTAWSHRNDHKPRLPLDTHRSWGV